MLVFFFEQLFIGFYLEPDERVKCSIINWVYLNKIGKRLKIFIEGKW
jgi:hypothetical protein